jgi:tetratricopeptide (TPR) repeat protein
MIAAQPLGAFPLPAGLMLVSDVGDPSVDGAVTSLLAGKLPPAWPAAMRAHQFVYEGDLPAAQAVLLGDDPITLFNRYVLWPQSVDPALLAERLPASLAPLVGVVRYAGGGSDEPPQVPDDVDVSPVVAALVLSAQATHELGRGDPARAIELLHEAAAPVEELSPPLAALLRGNAGTIGHEYGLDRAAARAELQAAAAALTDTDLVVAKAELHLQLGMLEHEDAVAGAASLRDAMHHYYTTLQLVTEFSAPFLWASAQLNLATAHQTAPMDDATDALRTGNAIQALRASQRNFHRDEYPAQWATATLNLANALVYTPSVKQGDNLVEAVELYEKVLATRGRDSDPLGRARVLSNQGNTLAHLGIFDQAKAKLYEARFLFEEHLDHDSALTVRSVLDEIARQLVPLPETTASGRLALGGVDEATMRALQAERDNGA